MVFVFLHHTSTPSRRCLNKAGIKLKVRLVIYVFTIMFYAGGVIEGTGLSGKFASAA